VWSPRAASASGGWWDNNGAISGCVAAYAAKGATSLAASYTNLTGNATYNAAPGVAPTFSSADGWTFNGSTQYLTTGIVPAATWTMIVRFSSATNNGIVAGSDGNMRFWILPNGASGVSYGCDANALTVSPALTSGVLAIANLNCYRNGVANGVITAGTATPAQIIYIGGRNLSGVVNLPIAAKIQALAIYSTTLTAGEVATLTTLMNAL
jgi:hypothetical protein